MTPTESTSLPFPILSRGAHPDHKAACLMEAVAFLAGEPWSDSPECACPVISAFGRRLNDAITDDETRTRLLGHLAPKLIGTRATRAVEKRRGWIAVDWIAREVAPLWLDLCPELMEHAAALRALPEITSKADAERSASTRDAARAAAWALRTKKGPDAAYAAYAYAAAAAAAYAAADAAADAADAYADAAADAAYAHVFAAKASLRSASVATWESGARCIERMIAVTP